MSSGEKCFLLIVLLWNLEVLDFLAQVIDWFLQGLGIAHLSGFLDVKSLFNGPQELGFNFDLYFDHFNLSASLLFNGKRYLLFAFFKGLNEGRYTNLLEDEFFFVVLRLWANFHNIYGKPFLAHGVDFDFVQIYWVHFLNSQCPVHHGVQLRRGQDFVESMAKPLS